MPNALRAIAGALTLLLGAALTACSGGAIATVNGEPISRADFDARLEAGQMARGVLQQMVQEALVLQYAKANNITVTDAQIQAREDQLKANFPAGTWDEMLAARGLTEDDVHDALRDQLILDMALGKNITISDAQIQQYFNKNHAAFDTPAQVRARHILVATLPTAEKVEALLRAGQSFATLAREYSIDPGTKDKGGELGFFRRGQMVPAFDQVAFSLPVGQISQPVKSPFGYHIIQVEARTPAQRATLASARSRIVDLLRQQQEAPLLQPFVQSLMQKANIQVNDPRFAGLFPPPPPAAPPVPATAVPPSAAPSPAHS